ncbi:hypothetical protein [Herminiimonas sp. CN]|uniref:hypothetical protein n=1 Tax=Herminiimonas sp. CN TaxID=1349818 RepID=UPI00047427E0|nr:hypothetical protein [Herminiimonas sp. CN]
MNNDALDATIPVLTEIIAQEQGFAGPASISTSPSPVSPSESRAADPSDALSAAAVSDSQWQTLEQQISERILRQLQTRIDFVLEHRIRDGLAEALQLAVEGMTTDIRRGLHQTLEDVIARAVSQEIARLQTIPNKPAHDPEDI